MKEVVGITLLKNMYAKEKKSGLNMLHICYL